VPLKRARFFYCQRQLCICLYYDRGILIDTHHWTPYTSKLKNLHPGISV